EGDTRRVQISRSGPNREDHGVLFIGSKRPCVLGNEEVALMSAERRRRRDGRALHAGTDPEFVEQSVVESERLLRFGIFLGGQSDSEGHDALRTESRIHLGDPAEAFEDQTRAHQEREGKRDLSYYQAAQGDTPSARERRSGAVLLKRCT